MIPSPSPASFSDWWESRCRAYLDRCLGPVEAELRSEMSRWVFPAAAEPTLPEQCLPLAFAHLRLLAGEDLGVVLRRVERLTGLFGASGGKPRIGTLYLMLTALTSAPGRLSSLARAQSAFFSLLLRRVAGLLDQGTNEESVRTELTGMWEIRAEKAVAATLEGGRGLWRRMHAPALGIAPLPFDLPRWLGENGLAEEARTARGLFPAAGEEGHLAALAGRLAVLEALRVGLGPGEGGEPGGARERAASWEQMRATLTASIAAGLEGLTPWESEALRPSPPLLSSLTAWGKRLGLLDGGESPTAYPGRERLPDWLRISLEQAASAGGMPWTGRFTVGGETYLIAGLDATAPGGLASARLDAPERPAPDRLALRVRFGEGSVSAFAFDLTDGKDLLAALRLTEQPDIRLDLIVRGEDGAWRFGASVYLVPSAEDRAAWLRYVFEYLFARFGGEEDRIRLEILRGVQAAGEG